MEQEPLIDSALKVVFCDNDIENCRRPELFRALFTSTDLALEPEDRGEFQPPPRHCLYAEGNSTKPFAHKADVGWRIRIAHERRYIDCSRKNCIRKGDQGFTRNDHLRKHRKQFHLEAMPKKAIKHASEHRHSEPAKKQ